MDKVSCVGPQAFAGMQEVLQTAVQMNNLDNIMMEEHVREAQLMLQNWQREQQSAVWTKYLAEESNVTLDAVNCAVAFSQQACDEKLMALAEHLLIKLQKSD